MHLLTLSSLVLCKCCGFCILAEGLVIGGLCGYYMQDSQKNARNQKLISCMLKLVSSKLLAELTMAGDYCLEFWYQLCTIKFPDRTLEDGGNTLTIVKMYVSKAVHVFIPRFSWLSAACFWKYESCIVCQRVTWWWLRLVCVQFCLVGFNSWLFLHLRNLVRPVHVGL